MGEGRWGNGKVGVGGGGGAEDMGAQGGDVEWGRG